MTDKLTIGLDLDGVVVDQVLGAFRHWENWTGQRPKACTTWEGLFENTAGDSVSFWNWAYQVPRFWEDMPPVLGALNGVWQLLKDGHTVKLVTHRSPSAREGTMAWLEQHWPKGYRTYDPLHIVKGSKRQVAADVYVDDSPHVIEDLHSQGLTVIRYAQPWNKGVKATAVAQSWKELLRLIDLIADPGDAVEDQQSMIDDLTGEVKS